MARAVGLLPALVWGVLAGLWRPRGPVFGFEALAVLVVSVVVGVLAGRVFRSRWAVVLAPAFFAVAGEVTRIGLTGPTVDYPRLTPLGLVALVAGRGAWVLFALLPMFVGAVYGAGSARSSRSRWRWAGRVVAVVPALAVLLTAVVVMLPARVTAVSGGVSQLTYVGKLGLMIRGARTDAPVLLVVPGWPGGSELGPMRQRLGALEKRFVVVTVDRRGGGRSFGALDPTPTFTVDNEMRNVIAVTDYLKARFRRDRVYLVAHGTGTISAALAVQEEPTSFAAYVGVAQMVDPSAADRGQYDDTLARARSVGDKRLVARLTAVGPPPYSSVYGYEPMLLAEDEVYGSGTLDGLRDDLRAPELSPLDKLHAVSGLLDAFDTYYPQLRGVDLKRQAPALGVAGYFVEGDREVPARVRDLQQWVSVLQAPRKEIVTLADAGHRSLFDQPAAFAALLDRVVAENPVPAAQ